MHYKYTHHIVFITSGMLNQLACKECHLVASSDVQKDK